MMKRRSFLLACGSTAFASAGGGGGRLKIGQIGSEHAHAAGKMEAMRSLTIEARQKLAARQPMTLAQAARIPGVTPADLQNLVVEVARWRRVRRAAEA